MRVASPPRWRAPTAERSAGSGRIPLGSWQRLTVLDALSCEGLVATMSIEASTSTPVLLAYLEQVLVPKLRQMKPDAILVMDNLRPHRATKVGELLEQARVGLVYLPHSSPEFNPIEHAWSCRLYLEMVIFPRFWTERVRTQLQVAETIAVI